ncbi:VOC family protein [Pedobacter yulinensis]|uniref:VOC family protein n=1 Tax=Pedobacter yulinensis TaxID=2126353 RepID=A0A2T3HLB6_9SPHI|nr:VOC family protein [Pedobacter yulinensis]PST83203.1 VOC family protein [Pedobacter yulinensis]
MTSNIPEGHHQVLPYLILAEAGKFYHFMQQVFGATERSRVLREDENTVMHGELQVGDTVIMYANATADWPPQPAGLFIYVDDADAAFQRARDAGGESIMEPQDQSYGRSGGIRDPFGNTWWITTP